MNLRIWIFFLAHWLLLRGIIKIFHRRIQMDQKTKATLIKMLGMTASSHDGEALVAIRKANALLAESNMNWHEFLMSFRISDQSYMTPPSKRKADWGNVNSVKNDAQHSDGDEINRLFENAYA